MYILAKSLRKPALPVCALLLALSGNASVEAGTVGVPAFKKLGDVEVCVRRSDVEECFNRVKEYVEKHPKEELEAARLVRLNFHSSVALEFFERAIKRHGVSVCVDKDLKLAALSGLALPGDYPNAVRARRIFSEQCLSELEPSIIREVADEKGSSYLKDNACPILQKNGKAPESCRSGAAEEKSVEIAPEVLPKLDKSKVLLEDGKAYRGGEGEKITLIPLKGSDLYLVRFDGLRGPWNGKTILHKREERGNGAATFWTEHNGARWNSIVQRDWIEVYAPEYKPGKGFSISYSETDTAAIVPQSVLDAWMP